MGLFSAFGGSGGLASTAASMAPTLLSGSSGFSLTGAAQGIIGGAVQGGMANILGTDPSTPCPGTAGGSGGGMGGANDPCGKGDDALKSALLGLGMASAAPAIGEIGGEIGGALDGGLGAISSTLGDGVMSAANGVGGAIGLDPDSPAQKTITNALGSGSMVALGGGDATTSAIGAITGATSTVSSVNKSKDSTGLFDAFKTTAGIA